MWLLWYKKAIRNYFTIKGKATFYIFQTFSRSSLQYCLLRIINISDRLRKFKLKINLKKLRLFNQNMRRWQKTKSRKLFQTFSDNFLATIWFGMKNNYSEINVHNKWIRISKKAWWEDFWKNDKKICKLIGLF